MAELTPPLQAKLLRVLQDGSFERVGGTQQLITQARIIAATNRDLSVEVQAGAFREDLFYRLKVVQIHMPPLRERCEDIPLLVRGLIQRLSRSLHRPPLQPTDAAMAQLLAYDWPGNVRELENTLTQALVRARDTVLTPELLALQHRESTSHAQAAPAPADPFRDAAGQLLSLDEVEAQHIQRVLAETASHKGRACETLGISRPALERKINKYRLRLPRRDILVL